MSETGGAAASHSNWRIAGQRGGRAPDRMRQDKIFPHTKGVAHREVVADA